MLNIFFQLHHVYIFFIIYANVLILYLKERIYRCFIFVPCSRMLYKKKIRNLRFSTYDISGINYLCSPQICVYIYALGIFYLTIVHSMSESRFLKIIRPMNHRREKAPGLFVEHRVRYTRNRSAVKEYTIYLYDDYATRLFFAIYIYIYILYSVMLLLTAKQRFHCLENPSLLHQYAIIVRLINPNERRVLSGGCKRASFVAHISRWTDKLFLKINSTSHPLLTLKTSNCPMQSLIYGQYSPRYPKNRNAT